MIETDFLCEEMDTPSKSFSLRYLDCSCPAFFSLWSGELRSAVLWFCMKKRDAYLRSDRTNREHSRHSHTMSHSIKKESTVRCFAQELFPQASCLSKGSTSAPSVRALKVASCITLCRSLQEHRDCLGYNETNWNESVQKTSASHRNISKHIETR